MAAPPWPPSAHPREQVGREDGGAHRGRTGGGGAWGSQGSRGMLVWYCACHSVLLKLSSSQCYFCQLCCPRRFTHKGP